MRCPEVSRNTPVTTAGWWAYRGLMSKFDRDNDGLSDYYEAWRGTNPDVADSDGDTVSDGDEVDLGWDPRTADPTERVDHMGG